MLTWSSYTRVDRLYRQTCSPSRSFLLFSPCFRTGSSGETVTRFSLQRLPQLLSAQLGYTPLCIVVCRKSWFVYGVSLLLSRFCLGESWVGDKTRRREDVEWTKTPEPHSPRGPGKKRRKVVRRGGRGEVGTRPWARYSISGGKRRRDPRGTKQGDTPQLDGRQRPENVRDQRGRLRVVNVRTQSKKRRILFFYGRPKTYSKQTTFMSRLLLEIHSIYFLLLKKGVC